MTGQELFFVAILTTVVAAITSLSAVALQSWKWKTAEQPKVRADAAGELTDTSLALVIAIRREMESNQEKASAERKVILSELADVREENRINREKLAELEDVKEWAERLVHQVRSLGGDPVKMRVRTAKI